MWPLRIFCCIGKACRTFLAQGVKISQNITFARQKKTVFSKISSKISILGYILPHESNINVAIAVILVCRKLFMLYDLPGRKYNNSLISMWTRSKRAWFHEMSHDSQSLPKSKSNLRVLKNKFTNS